MGIINFDLTSDQVHLKKLMNTPIQINNMKKKDEPKPIRIDGPLSSLITKELNRILKKEPKGSEETDDEMHVKAPSVEAYIYAIDAGDITVEAIDLAIESINSLSIENRSAYIQVSHGTSPLTQAFVKYLQKNNFSIYHNTQNLARSVLHTEAI